MTKPIDYLCHKIATLNETELYRDYKMAYEKLKADNSYQSLLIQITELDKEQDKEKYFELKRAITNCEIEFRHYERELNTYINYMIRKYNQIYNHVELEK